MSHFLRPATAADIPLIQSIANQTWWPVYEPILGREQVAYMLALFYSEAALTRQMEDEGQRFLLAGSKPDAVSGFASWSRLSAEACKLNKLYVLPGTQGSGLGRFLLEAVAAGCRDSGASSLVLNVNRYNPALGFYQSQGFSIAGEEDIDIGNGYFMNDYIMQRELV